MGSIHYDGSPFDHSAPYANGMPSSSRAPFVDGVGDDESRHSHAPLLNDSNFDILEWHPAYQSCQRYFLDHAQYEPATQAVCALINIRLPFQWLNNPIASATSSSQNTATTAGGANSSSNFTFNPYTRSSGSNLDSPNRSRGNSNQPPPAFVSPVPYIRRLIITGFDKPAILHGFFGDEYARGIMPHVECERRNYLFAAKHGGWRSCKKQYDTGSGGGGDETVPFMKPLDAVRMEELTAAEKAWSSWLCMEDWMLGPRAPEGEDEDHRRAEQRDGGVRMGRNDLPDGI